MDNYLNKIIVKNYNDAGLSYDEKTPVKNILYYFATDKEILSDEDRVKYDVDAYYYKNHAKKIDGTKYTTEEACHGDVLFPFWMPFQLSMFLAKGKSFMYYKSNLSATYHKKRQIDNLISETCFSQVEKQFTEFATLCNSKGNFILLPDRKMQNRGVHFEDRIDKTLFECFTGGEFSQYFSCDNEKVSDWIKKEHLEMLFKYGNITRENVLPVVEPCKFSSFYMSMDKISEYINNAARIISARNKILTESQIEKF